MTRPGTGLTWQGLTVLTFHQLFGYSSQFFQATQADESTAHRMHSKISSQIHITPGVLGAGVSISVLISATRAVRGYVEETSCMAPTHVAHQKNPSSFCGYVMFPDICITHCLSCENVSLRGTTVRDRLPGMIIISDDDDTRTGIRILENMPDSQGTHKEYCDIK